jgi:hypothetical protein
MRRSGSQNISEIANGSSRSMRRRALIRGLADLAERELAANVDAANSYGHCNNMDLRSCNAKWLPASAGGASGVV